MPIPIHDLLPEKLDDLARAARSRLCEDDQVEPMKLAWNIVGDELRQALCSVLPDDLLDLLGRAWASVPDVAAMAEDVRHADAKPHVVELGGHDFTHELNPVVAVTIGSCPCAELSFTFALAAHVSGVRLSVLDGHIVGGDLGELFASAELSLEGVPLGGKAETRKLAAPGRFDFDPPGIPIPCLARSSAAAG